MYNDYNDENENITGEEPQDTQYSFTKEELHELEGASLEQEACAREETASQQENTPQENTPQEDYTQPQYSYTPPEQPKKKNGFEKFFKKPAGLIASVVVVGLLAGLGGSAIGNAIWGGSASSTVYEGSRPSSVINTVDVDTSELMTAAEVYAANVNSTVGITTEITTNYWGYTTTAAASGSGFIITEDGYILTNYHVIESASSIKVTMYDDTSYSATLVGYDESNDIAVLKVDATGLTPVTLGDSDNLNVGDDVVAIGNPLGELTFSLTSGSVSALNREVTLSTNVTMNLIQTDCAINSGNSGGALFNLYGEVIGITNAKYSSSSSSSEASIDNIGFAIPINSVKDLVTQIIEKGYVTKPYIGVMVSDVSDEALNYGLPSGAAVASVTEGSPAETAGLQANDIITAVDGQEISGRSELSSIISGHEPGDTITLTVYRQGDTLSIDVTVGEQSSTETSESDDTAADNSSQSQSSQSQEDMFREFFGNGNGN